MAEVASSQLVNISFAGGIDERTRPEFVDPSSAFLSITNARHSQNGDLVSRPGYTYFLSPVVPTRIFPLRNALARLRAEGESRENDRAAKYAARKAKKFGGAS